MAKRQSVTAAELLAKLAVDPKHQQDVGEKEERRNRLQRELSKDEEQLVSECKAGGVAIESVWDLVNAGKSYLSAIPILARHLSVPHHPRTIQGIVRALTTFESKGIAFEPLVRLFQDTIDSESELKWLIGAAIAESATEDDAAAVIELADDESHGSGRAFLPLGLVKMPKDKAIPILERWIHDDTLAESARRAIQLLH